MVFFTDLLIFVILDQGLTNLRWWFAIVTKILPQQVFLRAVTFIVSVLAFFLITVNCNCATSVVTVVSR
jgi:hypothetical protein